MNRLGMRKWLRVGAGVVAGAAGLLSLWCWHYRIWSYSDYQAYVEVHRYPIGDDLWYGRVQAGHDLELFTTAHPPHRTREYGPFKVLSYFAVWPTPPNAMQFESMGVIARDGRLINAAAAGCTWHRVFFAMSTEEEAAFDQAHHDYWEERVKQAKRAMK